MAYNKCLASVDIDRITKEMDFQALQQNIMNITFCNVQMEVVSFICVCMFTILCTYICISSLGIS